MKIEQLSKKLPDKFINYLRARGITDLYPPQEQAIKKGVLNGENIVVSSPTASGKTLIGLFAAIIAAERGYKTLYLTPLKAIASEKYEELRELEEIGYRVALSTGDYDSSDPWLVDYDIILTTNEKADSLIRHHAPWFKDIGVVVADEIHLIDSPERGPTLELLLTRVRSELPDAQMIALSATIGNAEEIADWLNAKLIQSDWRPVPLREGVYYNGRIFFSDGEVRKIAKDYGSSLVELSMDIISEGGQSLIFRYNRRRSVVCASRHAEIINKILSMDEIKKLKDSAKKLVEISEDKLTIELAKLVSRGVAFHHAGLPYKARKMIEDLFRRGLIKVICATPTLGAGVNVPARRVIIADIYKFNLRYGVSEPITIMEYKQLAGRAGRPKYDNYGEAVIVTSSRSQFEEVMDTYMTGDIEDISSKLDDESSLRSHVLAAYATGVASSKDELGKFLSKTFYAHVYGSWRIEFSANNATRYLISAGFLEANNGKIKATPMGKRVAELYIDPLTADSIIKVLKNHPELDQIGYLHMIVITHDMPKLPISRKESKWLEQKFEEVRNSLLFKDLNELYTYDDYREYLRELKTLLLLNDWIEEIEEPKLVETYGIGPGDIYRYITTAEWLAYSSYELSKLLDFKEHMFKLSTLHKRIKNGVKSELLELVRIPGIGRKRARVLYNYGYHNLQDLSLASDKKLMNIPGIGPEIAKAIIEYVRGLSKI